MLKEERFSKIIQLVNEKGSVKTTEISEVLDTSLATVRRDLNELHALNKIVKVFGGASSIKNAQFISTEDDLDYKFTINTKEKDLIGKFAASLISENDFVYLDAGTSVEAIIDYISADYTYYVTNSLATGKKLSLIGKKVFIVPGEFKKGTGALIGASTCDYLDNFNFSIGFFGTNGIHEQVGFTTPDINEAMVKSKAISRCRKVYFLADSSKFGKVSKVTFSNDPNLEIITNVKNDGNDEIVIRKLKEGLWFIL